MTITEFVFTLENSSETCYLIVSWHEYLSHEGLIFFPVH